MEITEYKDGIEIYKEVTDRFAASNICMVFILPINKKTATGINIMANLLIEASDKRADIYNSLAEMGGAEIGCSVVKKGSNIILQIYGRVLHKYIENMLEIMRTIIAEPTMSIEAIHRAKRMTEDNIRLSYNNKRAYAKARTIELMYDGRGAGVCGDGYINEIGDIDINGFYDYMLNNANIKLFSIGRECKTEKLISFVKQENRAVKKYVREMPILNNERINEKDSVNQCRLCMGYTYNADDYEAGVIANELLGGNAGSQLFSNIREGQSLCYYVTAILYRFSPVMLIEAGIDPKCTEKAIEGIKKAVDSFEVDTKAMNKAIQSVISGYKLLYDSPSGIMDFYLGQSICGDSDNIDEFAKRFEKVDEQRIKAVIKSLKPVIYYSLGG